LQGDARGKVSEEEVKAFCRERLAEYKVPHVVEFRGELAEDRRRQGLARRTAGGNYLACASESIWCGW